MCLAPRDVYNIGAENPVKVFGPGIIRDFQQLKLDPEGSQFVFR
jgi:hypothetical protein